MKILIDMWMDGYETEEDMKEAIVEYIQDSLDFSASSVKILEIEGEPYEKD